MSIRFVWDVRLRGEGYHLVDRLVVTEQKDPEKALEVLQEVFGSEVEVDLIAFKGVAYAKGK